MKLLKKSCFETSIYIIIGCFFVHVTPIELIKDYAIIPIGFVLISFNASATLSDFIFDKKEAE